LQKIQFSHSIFRQTPIFTPNFHKKFYKTKEKITNFPKMTTPAKFPWFPGDGRNKNKV
jgi:hypothetical protein